mmetsp:Transcript_8301/g.13876  ORF Transcript_8301/g.13876 Transcript_8301/m.13876 type:complete len:128 (-) Transcript_8301:139-522(-)
MQILLEIQNRSENNQSVCLFLGLCYANPELNQFIKAGIAEMGSKPKKQKDFLDQLRTCKEVLSNFIDSNVENRVDSASVLTNDHLIQLNGDGNDEGLFFEVYYDQGAGGAFSCNKNLKPRAKRRLVG